MWCPWGDSKTPQGQPTFSLTTKAGRQATSVNRYISGANVNTRTTTSVVGLLLLAAADAAVDIKGVLFLVPLRGLDV